MDITITIPSEKVADVIAAFKDKYHYEEQILVDGELVPNPEGEGAFAKRMLILYIKSMTRQYLYRQAADAIVVDFELS